MFRFKLFLTVLLYVVAGALLLFLGTPRLYEALIPPFEQRANAAARTVSAELLRDAEAAVTAASAATAVEAVRAPLSTAGGELSDEAKKALLAPADGRLGAPAFGALVNKDGTLVAKQGEGPKLGDDVGGLPVVADALTGVMRDGLLELDGSLWVLAAAPVYFSVEAPAGVVLLAWPFTSSYIDALSKAAGAPAVYVRGDKRVGSAFEGVSASDLKDEAGAGFGELQTDLPVPLPVLVPDTHRYLGAVAPGAGGDAAAAIIVAVDRNEAFKTIAYGQIAVLFATLIPGLIVFLLVLNIMRSINKPMRQIMDHLSAYAQGTQVGILPEGALSGPFVRLGKQINMILQAPPPGSQPRGATSPLSPPTMPGNGESLDSPPPAPFTDPLGAGGAAALSGEGAEEPSFDGIPGLGSGEGPPAPPPPEDLAPAGDAPVSDDLQSSGLSGLFDEGGGGGGGDDPLAAFRVEGSQGGPPPPPPDAAPLPGAGLPGSGPPPPPSATEPPQPAQEDGLKPEATVMVQVPNQLIEQSTPSQADAPPAAAPAPQAEEQNDEARTVIAQVPPELLNQAASSGRVSPEEESHFREVFEEFVRTRTECGEDTDQLTYERFLAKLMKNRKTIIDKYNSKSVRFQVYVKAGKAALRAVPVRE